MKAVYVRRLLTFLSLVAVLLVCDGALPAALVGIGGPWAGAGPDLAAKRVPAEAAPGDGLLLDRLAEVTWSYLSSDWATSNHLPWSWRSATSIYGDYANTTEIGLYALSWLAAYDYQQPWSPSWAEAEAEVSAVLDQLRTWQTGSLAAQDNGTNAYQNSVFYQGVLDLGGSTRGRGW